MLKFSGLSCLLQDIVIVKDTDALRLLVRITSEITCSEESDHFVGSERETLVLNRSGREPATALGL